MITHSVELNINAIADCIASGLANRYQINPQNLQQVNVNFRVEIGDIVEGKPVPVKGIFALVNFTENTRPNETPQPRTIENPTEYPKDMFESPNLRPNSTATSPPSVVSSSPDTKKESPDPAS